MEQRLSRPDEVALAEETRRLLSLTARQGSRPAATMELLAHDPPLLGPFLGWAAALALEGSLSARDHEMVALRASHLCRSAYEAEEHAKFAREAGLSSAEIAAIAEGAGSDHWDDGDRLLLAAVDELHRDARVSDGMYRALADRYEPAALVEIPMVVGQYTMLSMLTGFFDVPAEGGDHRQQ